MDAVRLTQQAAEVITSGSTATPKVKLTQQVVEVIYTVANAFVPAGQAVNDKSVFLGGEDIRLTEKHLEFGVSLEIVADDGTVYIVQAKRKPV